MLLLNIKNGLFLHSPSWIPEIFRDINPDMIAHQVQRIYDRRIVEELESTTTGAFISTFQYASR